MPAYATEFTKLCAYAREASVETDENDQLVLRLPVLCGLRHRHPTDRLIVRLSLGRTA